MSHVQTTDRQFQAGVGMQEITMALQEYAGRRVLTVSTDDCGDACFLDLPLAIAREMRNWLNAQDFAE
jgi:hypothetical protein